MRLLMWVLRLLLFFLLFGFAVKNDHLVRLYFYFGAEWELPLVFVILVMFTAGALLGVTATFGALLRQRREIGRLRRQIARSERERPATAADGQAPEAY
ncbi:LapA family protein [Pseudothauera lacus]|uniref:DUF1049 domain-containing protein n=1 Tax=Pseudothauera lacus TaxID=2136175 RepID=A0A2T4IHP3_9RHOO|nr:LapA family protein [Pseudothauera lacus]PTD97295.1 DUF1049 domain-containing protein [Pseudothauera lacus]